MKRIACAVLILVLTAGVSLFAAQRAVVIEGITATW
jgi:hypothetical protein